MAGKIVTEPGDPPIPPDPGDSSFYRPNSQSILSETSATQAVVVPIAYGAMRLAPLLVEKYAPSRSIYRWWQASRFYGLGEFVVSQNAVYRCIQAGTSAGTASSFTAWAPSTAYTAWSAGQLFTSANSCKANNQNFYCSASGTSAASGTGPSTGIAASAGAVAGTVTDGSVTWTSVGQSNGGPSGKGTAVIDGSCIWTYVQDIPAPNYRQTFIAALCEGGANVTQGRYVWWDKERISNGSSGTGTGNVTGVRALFFLAGPDTLGQSIAPAYMMPVAFGDSGNWYQHTVLIGSSWGCETGTQTELPSLSMEVNAPLTNADGLDAYTAAPSSIIYDILTHTRRGLGWSASKLDPTFYGGTASSYYTYCNAAGFRFGMVIDTPRKALAILTDVLNATNSDAYWSDAMLKVKPLGDTSIASPVFGATGYIPSNAAVYNLGPADFLDKEQPVKWSRRSEKDTYCVWPVEFTDRSQDYVRRSVDDPDMAYAEVHGIRKASPTTLNVAFNDSTPAIQLSRILAQRSEKVRNTYTFRVSWRYCLLEPTDIVTLTDPLQGFNLLPVRILRIDEDAPGPDAGFTITAEDYPAGVSFATAYQPQVGDGYVSQDQASIQAMPSSANGAVLGIGLSLLGPGCFNPSQSNSNMVPNSEMCIWTPPATPDNSPPDGWIAYSQSPTVYPTYAAPVDDPTLWRAYMAPDTDSQNGDVSIKVMLPTNEATTRRGLHSRLIPITPGDILKFWGVVKSSVGAYSWIAIWWYDQNKAFISEDTGWNSANTTANVWTSRQGFTARAPANARWYAIAVQQRLSNVLASAGTANWFDSAAADRAFSTVSLIESSGTTAAGFGAYTTIDYQVLNTATEYIVGGDWNVGTYTYTVNAVDDGGLFSFNASIALTGAAWTKIACYKNGVLWREGAYGNNDGTRATGILKLDQEKLAAGDALVWKVYNPDAAGRVMEANAGRSFLTGGRVQ